MTEDEAIVACSVEDLFAHASFPELCGEAAAECANPELTAPMPDEDLYRLLEKSGSARCFRCGRGERLYGFALALLAPSGHNGRRYATVESLFIDRARRCRGAGDRMMTALEDAAREAGCEAIFYSAHVGSRLAKVLFLQPDRYPLTNHIFCRRLK